MLLLKEVIQEKQSIISRPYRKREGRKWGSRKALICISGRSSVLTAAVKKPACPLFFE